SGTARRCDLAQIGCAHICKSSTGRRQSRAGASTIAAVARRARGARENGIYGADRRVDGQDCRHQADWRSKAERAGFTRLVAGRLICFDDVERCARAVKSGFAVMALVTDAFGGHGGMAQYNRDFFGTVVNCGLASSLVVLPRFASNEAVTPAFVR